MAEDQIRDGQEWAFRFRSLEEKVIRLDERVSRLLDDASTEKSALERYNAGLDVRFNRIEKNVFGIQKVLWIATGVLLTIQVILHYLANFVYRH